jgi:hypothetical protein
MPERDDELEGAEMWDFESAKGKKPIAGRRTVVSVAFHADEFAVVSRAAQNSQMRLSEFIRFAALEKASELQRVFFVSQTISLSSSAVVRRSGEHETEGETMVSGHQVAPILLSA